MNELTLEEERDLHAQNVAAKALNLGLAGMTQERWNLLSALDQHKLQDRSLLNKQLEGLEGGRVEVIDRYHNVRRFWVGITPSWRPMYVEIPRKGAHGTAADSSYLSVVLIYHPRSARARR